MTKTKNENICFIRRVALIFLVLMLTLTSCSSVSQDDSLPPTSSEESKQESDQESLEDTEQEYIEYSDEEKEIAFLELKSLIDELKPVATEETVNYLASHAEEWQDHIPENLHDKIYYFDVFSGDDFERLSWQALIGITYVIARDENDWESLDENSKELITRAIPLDKRNGHIIIPLSIYSSALTGYHLDMFKEDGEWKAMPYNLINQIQTAEHYMEPTN